PESAISIDPIRRDRWLSSGDEEIRERAERIFASTLDGDRASVVARAGEEIAGLAGDRHRGRAVFADVCATCHRLTGVGRDVGPPLAELTDRSKEALLVAILDPNRAVLGSWVSYSAVLDDGQVLSGIIADETSTSVTIVGADGETRPILRERIARLESSERSLMPEGLESTLDAEKLADVIEFVRRAAPEPLGSGTPAEHRAARRAFRAEGPRGLARLIEAAETHPNHASWLGPLPIHVCRQRDGEGRVVWETSPVASDADASGRESFLLAAAMGWRSQPAGHFELRAFGRTLLRFELSLEDARWESDDGRVALDWVVLQRNAEDAVGRLTVELDRSLVEPGEPVRLEVRGSASRSERWFGVFTLPEKEEE
ncbi:MAG TPA: c-type cytochrome, partial [Planctomycetota bacterium]|nr:c-type cytochrome [Planctomycetota bacterium]